MEHPQPTDSQHRIADALGIDISTDTRAVAAARIHDLVAPAIEEEEPRGASERQIEFAESLGLDVTSDTYRIAYAKIDQELYRRNREALDKLQLKPGDRVIKHETYELDGRIHESEREFVVSSITDNLRVYFKGPGSQSGWPTQLRRIEE